MPQEEVIQYIVKELGKNRNPKDIVITLCEKTKMPWAEADKLVREVQSSHAGDIAAHQGPLLLVFSVVLLILGIGMIFMSSTTLSEGVMPKSSLRFLLLGSGLLLGGIIGLWKTISSLLKAK
jgi:hypothetical protein